MNEKNPCPLFLPLPFGRAKADVAKTDMNTLVRSYGKRQPEQHGIFSRQTQTPDLAQRVVDFYVEGAGVNFRLKVPVRRCAGA